MRVFKNTFVRTKFNLNIERTAHLSEPSSEVSDRIFDKFVFTRSSVHNTSRTNSVLTKLEQFINLLEHTLAE